jgi:outer membrane biosynthesis protein TonB
MIAARKTRRASAIVLLIVVTADCQGRSPQPARPSGHLESSHSVVSAQHKAPCELDKYLPIAIPERMPVLARAKPSYPAAAVAGHVEGRVSVTVVVNASGAVVLACAQQGPEILRAAAEDAARQFRFAPWDFSKHRRWGIVFVFRIRASSHDSSFVETGAVAIRGHRTHFGVK